MIELLIYSMNTMMYKGYIDVLIVRFGKLLFFIFMKSVPKQKRNAKTGKTVIIN